MTQVTDYDIPASPLTMAALATTLEEAFAALGSDNRGATAPSNPFEGMTWQDSNTTPTEYIKKYTVTGGWTILCSINITTGVLTPYYQGTVIGDASVKTVGVALGNLPIVNQAVTDKATATNVTLGTTLNIRLTGTTPITGFTGVAGVTYHCRADAAFTLTHHATNLIITQGGANIVTAAGDTFDVQMITSTTARIINYVRATPESSFSVYGTTQTNITGEDKVLFPTEEFDSNSDFASNRFTPTIPGRYLLCAQIQWASVVATDNTILYIRKNGSDYKHTSKEATVSSFPLSISTVVDANGTTDYFEVFAQNVARDTSSLVGVGKATSFSGGKIGGSI